MALILRSHRRERLALCYSQRMALSFSFIDDGDEQALPVVFLHAFP